MNRIVNWKTEDGIGYLSINKPPSNMMTTVFFDELQDIVSYSIDTKGLEAIIIYGEGRHFSAGADLNDLLKNIKDKTTTNTAGDIIHYPGFLNNHYKTFTFFQEIDIPVIAAIRGVCLGSALELALFCDIRICGEGSILGLPESTYNLIPGCGGIQKLLRLCGQSKALELILTGKTFTAEDAFKWNIIDRIVPKKEVINIAVQLAKREKISEGVK